MDIAALNTRIIFQKSTVLSDKIGNRTNQWQDYYKCFATISDSQGGNSAESSIAGLIVEHTDVSFTVRYCKKTMNIKSTEYRVLWNGDIYNIVKIDHLNLKKRALKFKCQKERS